MKHTVGVCFKMPYSLIKAIITYFRFTGFFDNLLLPRSCRCNPLEFSTDIIIFPLPFYSHPQIYFII